MDTILKKIFNKKIVALLFVVLAFSSIEVPQTQAYGAVVYDPVNYIENSLTAANSVITSGSAPVTATAGVTTAATNVASLSWTAVGKNLLDYAAYSAAQKLLNQLTSNTIKWIQGGFHGSPSFAVDMNAIATQVADEIAGEMVLDIKNISVCNFTATYKDDLTNAVTLSSQNYQYVYQQKAKCPFKETYNFKASDFYNDLSRFTWSQFGAALEPGGNPYSLSVLTAQEMAARKAAATATQNQKLSWSNGFTDIIDTTSCNYRAMGFYAAGDPTPGANLSGTQLTAAEADQLNKAITSSPTFPAMQRQYCKTTTPGKIVSDQLSQTLGVDLQKVGFADNMNKIIAAFLDQLTQKTIRSVFGTGDSYASVSSQYGYVHGGSSATSTGPVIVPPPGSGSSSITTSGTSITATVSTGTAIPGQTTSEIHGTVLYKGYDPYVNVSFKWGTDPNNLYSLTKEQPPLPVQNYNPFHGVYSASTPQDFQATLSGLKPNTTYYYQATVQTSPYPINSLTTPVPTYGQVLSFTTLP